MADAEQLHALLAQCVWIVSGKTPPGRMRTRAGGGRTTTPKQRGNMAWVGRGSRISFIALSMVTRPNTLIFPLDVQPFVYLSILGVEVPSAIIQSFGVLVAIFAWNGDENSDALAMLG